MWGGEVKSPFESTPLPQWLMQICQTLVGVGVFGEEKRPNHALINALNLPVTTSQSPRVHG
uniref:Uncharacterized protein n=1 Tax=Hyaloperonospora arabidopsidis (strain Emoy2) TaxID=559515 RepID=M4BZY1_HYAAE